MLQWCAVRLAKIILHVGQVWLLLLNWYTSCDCDISFGIVLLRSEIKNQYTQIQLLLLCIGSGQQWFRSWCQNWLWESINTQIIYKQNSDLAMKTNQVKSVLLSLLSCKLKNVVLWWKTSAAIVYSPSIYIFFKYVTTPLY